MQIAAHLVVGIDLGLSHIAWSIIDNLNHAIVDAGVWTFHSPETAKDKTPKSQIRKQMRVARTAIKRRRQRMNNIRSLLVAEGLLLSSGKAAAANQTNLYRVSPWTLRAEGLDRKLSAVELGVCLYHIAKHRGFQSNRKGEVTATAVKNQEVSGPSKRLSDRISAYRTFGEALCKDRELSRRKRNSPNSNDRTPERKWLRDEVIFLFDRQRDFGSEIATQELERQFIASAFTQGACEDQAQHVGSCPFEPGEKRASKHAPSFEKVCFLSKLGRMRLYKKGSDDAPLSPAQILLLEGKFGMVANFSYRTIRETLKLDPEARFRGVAIDAEVDDIFGRKSASAVGTRLLQKVLGQLKHSLTPEALDDAMYAIAFYKNSESLAAALDKIALPQGVLDAVASAVAQEEFAGVTGAAHISAKACRALLKGLRTGASYSEACKIAGYDRSVVNTSPLIQLRKTVKGLSFSEIRREISNLISDPKRGIGGSAVTRKALIEGVKHFVALVNDHPALRGNLPGQVNVRVSGDIGRSVMQRADAQRALARDAAELVKSEEDFEKYFGHRPDIDMRELLKFQLVREQDWRCLYTGQPIEASRLFDEQRWEISHILPWSRFGDDSFTNLTLSSTDVNQAKANFTPYEWSASDEVGTSDFDLFSARVEACNAISGEKKRNYLLRNGVDVEAQYLRRAFNDTRSAPRLLLECLQLFYPEAESANRLYARPGSLMSKVREAWKVDAASSENEEIGAEDDRIYALAAIAVAAVSKAMLVDLSKARTQAARGPIQPYSSVKLPWYEFTDQAMARLSTILVSRAEERRVSGQTHLDTVRGLNSVGDTVFERLSPENLMDQVERDSGKGDRKVALEKRFLRPERSRAIISALLAWQAAGRPFDAPPVGPTGDKLGKIKVIAIKSRPAVTIRGGTADRGEMARVDVFSRPTPKGKKQYFLVPVYPHQIVSEAFPPARAVQAQIPESEWPVMDHTYQFEFCIFPKSWLQAVRANGSMVEGYFRGLDRSTGSIMISPHATLRQVTKSIGVRNLQNLTKHQVTRLGTKNLIVREKRTWRGKVCAAITP